MSKRSPQSVVFLTVCMDLIGFGIVIPLLPFYALHMGASGFQVGLLISIYSLMQFIFAPLIGRLSDRIGRRPVMLATISLNIIGYTLFGWAKTLPLLLLSRAISGLSGANISVAQACMADVTTPENRAKGMGMVGAAFGIGFTIGPAIGGLLGKFSYSLPGYFAALLCLINFLMAIFILPETLPPEKRGQQRLGRWATFVKTIGHRETALYIFLFFMMTLAFSQVEATFSLFAKKRLDMTVTQVGYIFTLIGIIVGLIQGTAIGPLSKRFGERRLLMIGMFSLSAALALMSQVLSISQLVAVTCFMAVGNALNQPSIMSLLSRSATSDVQGGTLGAGQSASALARILGPMIGGLCFDHLGIGAPFLTAAALVMVAWGTLVSN